MECRRFNVAGQLGCSIRQPLAIFRGGSVIALSLSQAPRCRFADQVQFVLISLSTRHKIVGFKVRIKKTKRWGGGGRYDTGKMCHDCCASTQTTRDESRTMSMVLSFQHANAAGAYGSVTRRSRRNRTSYMSCIFPVMTKPNE